MVAARPVVLAREMPCSATELAKLQEEHSCSLESLNVCAVWLSPARTERGLTGEEVLGSWCVSDCGGCCAPWFLTGRAECQAGGLDPLGKEPPVAIPTLGLEPLTSGVQKAACLQQPSSKWLKALTRGLSVSGIVCHANPDPPEGCTLSASYRGLEKSLNLEGGREVSLQ